MNKSLSIKFSPEDYEAIKSQAKQSGLSASAVVREAFHRDQDTLFILRELLGKLDKQERQLKNFYNYSKKVDEAVVKLLKELVHATKNPGGCDETN